MTWRLIHAATDRQVYHRVHTRNGVPYMSYIRIGDDIYPWLTLDEDLSTDGNANN